MLSNSSLCGRDTFVRQPPASLSQSAIEKFADVVLVPFASLLLTGELLQYANKFLVKILSALTNRPHCAL